MTEIVKYEDPLNFIHHLEQIMTDPTFRCFFDEYFKTWGDTKATLMLMKAYIMIEEETKKIYGKDQNFDSSIVSEILRNVLKNSETRKYLVESMESFMSNTHRKTFNEICLQTIQQKNIFLIKN